MTTVCRAQSSPAEAQGRGAQTSQGIAAEKIHNDPTVPSEYRNSTLYYHYNHRGDVLSVSDDSGKHVWQSDYDAFGQPLPVKSEFAAFDPRYTFSSKRYFAELGTYYYGYRWYLPEICRWMQKDPQRAALNHYRMCRNNCIMFCDRYGCDHESLADRILPGKVINNSSKDVYILNGRTGPQGQGHYDRLGPGESSNSSGWGSSVDDVDGVWSQGKFYPVYDGETLTIGPDGKPETNYIPVVAVSPAGMAAITVVDPNPPWDGTTYRGSPESRGAEDNNDPTPHPRPANGNCE